jgi:hypothetical protein
LKNNNWQKRFGKRRREIDKALLAAASQAIEAEERETEAQRAAIARAFGRPLS